MTDRSRGSRSWLAVVALLAGGCTAEFIVGESGGSSSTGLADDDGSGPVTNADDGPATDAEASAGAETTSSDTLPLEDTGSVESTGGAEGDPTTTGVETTAETGVPETGVTEASAEEAGTTGEPLGSPCADFGTLGACQEDWQCDWYGEEGAGNCWHDPCVEGAELTCNGLDNAQCLDAPLCTWEAGECSYTNCAPLNIKDCATAPGCDWAGDACAAVTCNDCVDQPMMACIGLEQCQWVPEEPGFCSSS